MKRVKKIWGEELWVVNRDYCGKILLLKRGFSCSLHRHKIKDETFYIIRGNVLMEVGDKKWIMKPRDFVRIPPNTWHRFSGLTSAEIVEFSTHHKDSDTERKTKSGKSKLKVAYDFDGVVDKGIELEFDAPIITGRSYEEVDKIPLDIFLNHPVYFNPVPIIEKTLESEIRWKAHMIRRLGIEVYYEDNPEIIVRLEKLCPNCHIVKV
ncbi:hypothetical protein DRP43_04800 [candidate division TA06 bacterium]|uniref:Cupin type-2 domain-containing protein n=1 Tax=candidate division TA06 bacterium TaxID=2250710 RepID=A0A660SGH2_UNCT6|nr:MAG: hypothetical protein DRP43_04800 [candidate division TA06 bacterium]